MNQGILGDVSAVVPEVAKSGLLVSLCTITVPPEVFGPSGAPIATAPYIPLSAEYTDIPCSAPPLGIGETVQPTEVKDMQEISAKQPHDVFLGGYFPLITMDCRAVVDGIEYDIVGINQDSQKQHTSLAIWRIDI